jgi:RNA polymerase sigma-70 factor (ECF subfamily)
MQMINSHELIEVVEKARLGDKASMDRLAEEAGIYLYENVFRITLQADLSRDIVQECILEMYKIFYKLKKADRFFAWLDGIAFNKIRAHYGRQWRHKTISLSEIEKCIGTEESQGALAEMINNELKQIVLESMCEISPRQRAVLTMRCYKGMRYSEIAEAMGCTQFGAQALFYRAKKALAKRLARHGLGKESLVIALVLFGKLTATSEAAAAGVSITATTLKVGIAASLAATITGKTAIVSLVTAGAITAGTMTVTNLAQKTGSTQQGYNTEIVFNPSVQGNAIGDSEQAWYFFPQGAGMPVMMRKLKFDEKDQQSYCQYLQNQHANYYYDKDTVSINNFRMYNPDLSVARLPIDDEDLSSFISNVEGKRSNMDYVSARSKGLLVISGHLTNDKIRMISRYANVLEEEYFQFDWPQSVKVLDNRDEMHKRGWTYFRVDGTINGKTVSGAGQIPFVYEKISSASPWLKLKLSDGSTIVDSGNDACVIDNSGRTLAAYPSGTFFKGLSRPWMGLHTIDTVRRDAAEEQLWFETKQIRGTNLAEIITAYGQTRLNYTISLKNDLVEKIALTSEGADEGELRFTYFQDIDEPDSEFIKPRVQSSVRAARNSPGLLWLVNLINNSW